MEEGEEEAAQKAVDLDGELDGGAISTNEVRRVNRELQGSRYEPHRGICRRSHRGYARGQQGGWECEVAAVMWGLGFRSCCPHKSDTGLGC